MNEPDDGKSFEILFDSLRPPCLQLRPEHEDWRRRVRAFVSAEINPWLAEWEANPSFSDNLYLRAVEHGVFGLGFPRDVRGTGEGTDIYHRIILAQEMHRTGSGLMFADLATLWIRLPPVISAGASESQDRIVRPMLSGKKNICFAVTEPSCGSDFANLLTRAQGSDGGYRLYGEKTLISAALRADYALVIARTGGAGMGGLSLLVDLNQEGVSRRPVPGLHWHNRNVGNLNFYGVLVPGGQCLYWKFPRGPGTSRSADLRIGRRYRRSTFGHGGKTVETMAPFQCVNGAPHAAGKIRTADEELSFAR